MSENRPDYLWHYTSVDAMDAILMGTTSEAGVKSWHLRMSHADYLNDPAERRLVYAAFEKELSRLPGDEADQIVSWHYNEELLYDLAPFVASFSANSDNLLLWRMYADSLRGVAICFEVDTLLELAAHDDRSTYITPVVYGQEAIEPMAQRHVELAQREAEIHRESGVGTSFAGEVAFGVMSDIAPHYKSQGWKQEEEWRVVSRMSVPPSLYLQDPDLAKRYKSNWSWDARRRKPFMLLPFDIGAIEQIVVGPCGDRLEVLSILNAHGYDIPVWTSETVCRC